MNELSIDERLLDRLPEGLSKEGHGLCLDVLKGLEGIRSNVEMVGLSLQNMSEVDRLLFIQNCPSAIRTTLNRCLEVAEGRLHPKLATASGRAAQKLRKLPVSEQEKYLVDLIPVALPDGDEQMMDAETMPAELLPQVFSEGGKSSRVRSINEQREWKAKKAEETQKKADAEKSRQVEINRPNRWAIKNGRVYLAKHKIEKGLSLDDIEAIKKDLKL